jgi:hypothetical protein
VWEGTAVISANSDIFADLDRLRLSEAPTLGRPEVVSNGSSPSSNPKRIRGEFLKGPIPLSWLTPASKLPGRTLAVALAIWFEAGRRKSSEVKLTTAILSRFGVNRKAKYAALAKLEEAKLIRVLRAPRRNPVVTILNLEGSE